MHVLVGATGCRIFVFRSLHNPRFCRYASNIRTAASCIGFVLSIIDNMIFVSVYCENFCNLLKITYLYNVFMYERL